MRGISHQLKIESGHLELLERSELLDSLVGALVGAADGRALGRGPILGIGVEELSDLRSGRLDAHSCTAVRAAADVAACGHVQGGG